MPTLLRNGKLQIYFLSSQTVCNWCMLLVSDEKNIDFLSSYDSWAAIDLHCNTKHLLDYRQFVEVPNFPSQQIFFCITFAQLRVYFNIHANRHEVRNGVFPAFRAILSVSPISRDVDRCPSGSAPWTQASSCYWSYVSQWRVPSQTTHSWGVTPRRRLPPWRAVRHSRLHSAASSNSRFGLTAQWTWATGRWPFHCTTPSFSGGWKCSSDRRSWSWMAISW